MFVDEVKVVVVSGDGGDGCTAFRREKFVPMGGPAGGNGGRGSHIIFKVDSGLRTLVDLKFKKTIKGERGENGSGSSKTGKDAKDIIIRVPRGTVVIDEESGLILGDLKHLNDELIIARGGRGGRGNKTLATQSNPAPNVSEKGEPGEKINIKVELKLVADVGLLGIPNVGKSTILSKITNATPKIASYKFTTINPNLGVVTYNNKSFIIADLPGLIEGASKGIGLGIKFLKHAERTKVLAHVIDMSGSEMSPIEAYNMINNELKTYDERLLEKSKIIIANKMDLEKSKDNLKEFKKQIKEPIFEISALNEEGLDKVIIELFNIVENIDEVEIYSKEKYLDHILYTFKEEKPFTIIKEGKDWRISGDKVEKLYKMTKLSTEEGLKRFTNRLRNMGIDDKLKELGAQDGDTVKILDFEFIYID